MKDIFHRDERDPRGQWALPTALLARIPPERRGEITPDEADSLPIPPPDLDVDERVLWEEMSGAMRKAGILKHVDHMMFGVLMTRIREYKSVAVNVQKYGFRQPIKNKEGETVGSDIRPEAQHLLECEAALIKLAREFGLTPASRAGLNAMLLNPDDRQINLVFETVAIPNDQGDGGDQNGEAI